MLAAAGLQGDRQAKPYQLPCLELISKSKDKEGQ